VLVSKKKQKGRRGEKREKIYALLRRKGLRPVRYPGLSTRGRGKEKAEKIDRVKKRGKKNSPTSI